MDFWPILTVLFFFVIFAIQFALFYLLYHAIKKSILKITDVESLMTVTAAKVLSLKEKTSVDTYKEVITRLKEGQGLLKISEDLEVDIEELEALSRLMKSVKD